MNVETVTGQNKYVVDEENWKSLFHVACAQGNLGTVKMFVKHVQGFDVNEELEIIWDDYGHVKNVTGFELACQKGNLNIVKFLSLHGAHYVQPFNLLTLATKSRNVPVVKYLMSLGFCAQIQKTELASLFLYAGEGGDYAMAKFYLELGVNINARNNMKETLFHVACSSNMDNVNFVKWLMNQNGDINLVNGDGWSGFHYACYNENLKIAKFLVESGVDVNQVTSHGATGVHLLCRKEHPKFELIQYLCNNGYDINLCDAYGDTGLQALNTTLIIQTNTKMQPLEKDRKKQKNNGNYPTKVPGFL